MFDLEEFRKTAGKNPRGNYLPFISGSRLPVTQLPVMQLPVAHAHAITSGDVTIPIDPPQIRFELCLYTTLNFHNIRNDPERNDPNSSIYYGKIPTAIFRLLNRK
jgi:hypothetical protein